MVPLGTRCEVDTLSATPEATPTTGRPNVGRVTQIGDDTLAEQRSRTRTQTHRLVIASRRSPVMSFSFWPTIRCTSSLV